MKQSFPWAMVRGTKTPIGLRDCVARIAYLEPALVKQFAHSSYGGLLAEVSRWRLEQPEQFAELLALVTTVKQKAA